MAIHYIKDIVSIRAEVNLCRAAGKRIALVPTMGNLHAGHMELVKAAQSQADCVIVSIFVNPTQFGEGEDFSSYPRTLDADLEKLEQAGVNIAFIPLTKEIYPRAAMTEVCVSQISESLCGASRLGHFNGVATVVCKLFNIIQPDVAYFGEKDFQQLAVIRTLVIDLNSPVNIIPIPIYREPDGLAMSSRNRYLTGVQRSLASQLYQSLCRAKEAILLGQVSYSNIEELAFDSLKKQGFEPEYFSICRKHDLQKAVLKDSQLVILLAARLGRTRLIDNLQLDLLTTDLI